MLPFESLCLCCTSGLWGRYWLLIGEVIGGVRRFLYMYVVERGGLVDFMTVFDIVVAGDFVSCSDIELDLLAAGEAAGDRAGGV